MWGRGARHAAFNLMIFAGVFSLQWGIGLAIDALSAAGWSTVSAFRGAMALWGVCALLAYLWFLRHEAPAEAAPEVVVAAATHNPPSMAGLLIIAHAPLASSLKAVASHAFPDCGARLEVLDVAPDMSPEQIENQARELLERVRGPEALIFTDVFGATPCNGVMRLVDGQSVRAVAGVNVPMLWRTLCYQSDTLDRLVERATAGAAQGVMHVTQPPRLHQSQPPHAKPHDQDEHRDQQ